MSTLVEFAIWQEPNDKLPLNSNCLKWVPGAHYTEDFSLIIIQICWKYYFAPIQNASKWLSYNVTQPHRDHSGYGLSKSEEALDFTVQVNSLAPRRCGIGFTNVFFKLVLLTDFLKTFYEIGLRWQKPICDKSALVQVMTWCREAISHYPSQSWPSFHVVSLGHNELTHRGWVTHICVSNLTTIGSDNGLLPGRRQAIIQTNAGILLIEPPGTNFNAISIEIHIFSFKKIHFKMSSGKWRPFCLGLNVLMNPMNLPRKIVYPKQSTTKLHMGIYSGTSS